MSNPFRRICLGAWTLARGRRDRGGRPAQAQGGPVGPGAAAVRQARHAAKARAAPVRRHPAHQGRADARREEARGPRDRDPHPPPAAPFLKSIELDCGQGLNVKRITVGPEQGSLHLPPRRRQAVDRPRQAPRARRHARAGHRVRRLTRPRHPLHPPRPRLPREADGHLDPGRGRGHAPLAPLLRLPQRPRHHRDDRHGREAAVRPLQRGPGRHAAGPGQHHDLPLEDGCPVRQLPHLAGRRRLLGLSRQGRRPAGGLLRGPGDRRGDGAAVHGQDAAG